VLHIQSIQTNGNTPTMKKLLPLLLATFAASAAHAATFTDYAQVVSASPIYDQVVTHNCTDVPVTETYQPTQAGNVIGAVAGGLLGGLAGHAMGGGSGKTVLTIGGAVGGALAGQALADTPTTQVRDHRECQDVVHPQLSGYSVTYDYHGRTETTTLPYNPGERLEMQVTAQPVVR
jgi:uncharacterized protein YcfJ